MRTCTATCPTYVVLGDERDSPRGRIYAIKDMLERGLDSEARSLDAYRSLPFVLLVHDDMPVRRRLHAPGRDRAQHIEKTGSRSLKDRMIRRALTAIVPYPRRFRLAMRAAPLGRRLSKTLRALNLPELAAMIDLAPIEGPHAARFRGPGTA